MRKKMLRSVLVAAFSTVVAVGALSGLVGAKGDTRADSTWGPAVAAASDSTWGVVSPVGKDDSTWG
jgi:hypothetical protein